MFEMFLLYLYVYNKNYFIGLDREIFDSLVHHVQLLICFIIKSYKIIIDDILAQWFQKLAVVNMVTGYGFDTPHTSSVSYCYG